MKIRFTLNGKSVSAETHPMKRLLDLLREEMKLTGTKEGCGEGECGACSVFIDGKIINSCLVPAIQANGSKIKTIEGVGGKSLHAVQESFLKFGGAQCGICTPGMVMAAVQLVENHKGKITDDEIRTALAGNLCRCTGYMKIFDAVKNAVRMMK